MTSRLLRNSRGLRAAGFSMIGMLITLVCMVVLFAIGMSAMNKAVTGEGSAASGTVRSMEDKLYLQALYQSMLVNARDHRGRFITPSEVTGTGDRNQDTTASLFSAMLMDNYTSAEQLISGNEYSGYVDVDDDYDFRRYDPRAGVYWDPNFMADLEDLSNTSFAHQPLYGKRFDKHWQSSMSSTYPILGNRGPKDGVDDPTSWTYGRNGIWGGHLVYGDGHVEFINSFTPGNVFYETGGQRYADNIFAMEEGPEGADAILSFTRKMTQEGPELQFD